MQSIAPDSRHGNRQSMSVPDYKKIGYRHTADDWHIIGVGFEIVPNYDFEAACKGMGQQEIEAELRRNWSVSHGRVVYPEFSRQLHVAKDPIEPNPRGTYFLGWDLPGCPACVITQLNEYGQWLLLGAVVQPENESIGVYEFAERVAERLQRVYALPYGLDLDDLKLVHIGDPAGNFPVARTGRKRQEVRSAFDVLRRGSRLYMGEDEDGQEIYEERPGWGWHVVSGELTNTKRQEAMRARLTTTLSGGLSSVVACPTNHPVIDGFASYVHKKIEGMEGMYSREPVKNHACVDVSTQALTPSGWKYHHELSVGDPLYVYDMERNRLRLGTCLAVNLYEEPTEAIHFRGKALDMLVTPNHKCLARRQISRRGKPNTYEGPFLVRADELHSGHHLVCQAPLDHSGKPQQWFSNEFIRICAWVATEGTYKPFRDDIAIYQSESYNPQYVDEIDTLLRSYPGIMRRSPRMQGGIIDGREIPASSMVAWVLSRELAWLVRHWMPDKFPSYEMIHRMSISQMRLFIYEAIRGDGCGWGRETLGPIPPPPASIARERDFFVRPGTVRLYQSVIRESQMERVQAMATLAGLDGRLRYHDKPNPRVALSLCRNPRNGTAVCALHKEIVALPAVWCPTTDGGTWVARREGRAFITGNSHIMNATEYACTRLSARHPRKERDEDEEQPSRFQSGAAPRWSRNY